MNDHGHIRMVLVTCRWSIMKVLAQFFSNPFVLFDDVPAISLQQTFLNRTIVKKDIKLTWQLYHGACRYLTITILMRVAV